MNEESQMSSALDAIHDVALYLLAHEDASREVAQGLDLIVSLARHKFDVRSQDDINKYSGDG